MLHVQEVPQQLLAASKLVQDAHDPHKTLRANVIWASIRISVSTDGNVPVLHDVVRLAYTGIHL
jgi:hypothetical protein